ncbi:MAG TPA: TIGR03668 family PPOX class F420-dependent oxidoreductase [Chloroflexota bacterium]|nr:TIGR03668 family PPOX class F420-dependent oxidoreductase [Chloroflexota bacterium]
MTEQNASPLSATQWRFLAAHRVARLASVGHDGRPHLVPICFATDGLAIYSSLDEKPKRVAAMQLRRVRNLLRNPEVTLLVDDYAEDWTRLAYLMVRGTADLVEPGVDDHRRAAGLLRTKYSQYERMTIEKEPVIRVIPASARQWSWGEDAFGDAEAPPARNLDFDAVVRGRRSVRSYRPEPVPRALVERVLEAARWAPSPHGRTPWRFVVVTRRSVKERLVVAMGEEWERHLAMDGESTDVIARRKLRSQQRILEAPVCVILCLYTVDPDRYPDAGRQAAEATMAVQSLGAAAQNVLLTAYQSGLDGGWICAPLFCPAAVRAALDLGPDLEPQALLTLGYAARDPVRRERLSLEELIVWYE